VLGRVTAALIGAAALGGCSLGGDEEPARIGGAAQDVARVVERLERAIRLQDYELICAHLFSARARELAGGEDCESLMRDSAGDVREPAIRLLAIELEGEHARARVRTRAVGQAPVEEELLLVREQGEWRIETLAPG
jgi:hypothetical protein